MVFCHVHQRQPLLAVHPVVQHCVALHEGPSPRVLTHESDRGALEQKGSHGDEFSKAPVDIAGLGHLATLVQQWLKFRVHAEAGRLVVVGLTDQAQDGRVNPGGLRFARSFITLRSETVRPGKGSLVFRCDRNGACLDCVSLLEGLFETVVEVLLGCF